jgi:hypothetical protein
MIIKLDLGGRQGTAETREIYKKKNLLAFRMYVD